MEFLMWCLGSLLAALLGVEVPVASKAFARWLVGRAVKRLPVQDQASFHEEWLALLDELNSPTLQLLHAFSLFGNARATRDALTETSGSLALKFASRAAGLSLLIFSGPLLSLAWIVCISLGIRPIRTAMRKVNGRMVRVYRFNFEFHSVEELPVLVNVLKGEITIMDAFRMTRDGE
jgi:hypothetical protein